MARPDVFATLTFDAALERSRTDKSILIVDAMAAWCGPCRTMDRTTWIDAEVIERLTGEGGAFAIQLDVDAEPADAARLEISAMPTLVAFVGGVEHDRVVGGRRPADLIAWLDLVARGERFEDAQRAVRRELLDRSTRARELVAAGSHADALPECVWLWANTLAGATRHLGFLADLRRLVDEHAPARAAFVALRDGAAPRPDEPLPPIDELYDWTALNRVIDDTDATVRWYDANALELPPSPAIARFVEFAIVPLLIERERWCDIGTAMLDPAETFRRYVDADRGVKPSEVRLYACQFTRALYAAGRDERANDLEFEVRSIDASVEMANVLASAKALGRDDRVDVLIARERWAEAGTAIANPVARVERAIAEGAASGFVDKLVRALEAARRDTDARAVVEAATKANT